MAKDHNAAELERQKSAMLNKGYSHNEINTPNIRAHFNATGDSASQYHKRHSGGGSSCFPAETKVLTPSGWERIADLAEGGVVLSYGPDGKLAFCRITRRLQHKPCSVFTVRTSRYDVSLQVTKAHALNTSRGWVRISQLKRGDALLHIAENGKLSRLTVSSVKEEGRIEPVYNLIVEKNYTFVVQGCIAHSFAYLRKTRIMLHEIARYVRLLAASPKKSAFASEQIAGIT